MFRTCSPLVFSLAVVSSPLSGGPVAAAGGSWRLPAVSDPAVQTAAIGWRGDSTAGSPSPGRCASLEEDHGPLLTESRSGEHPLRPNAGTAGLAFSIASAVRREAGGLSRGNCWTKIRP